LPRRDLHGAGATAAVVVHGRRVLAHSDAPFEGLLGRYVVLAADGVTRVDYRSWKANVADRASLAQYIAELSASLPSRMAPAAAFAFWCARRAPDDRRARLRLVLERCGSAFPLSAGIPRHAVASDPRQVQSNKIAVPLASTLDASGSLAGSA
jgi:hypothetical protein